MAEFIGKDGIHHISGTCELCGSACDPGAEELNCLSCTFQQCDSGVYHQDCLEKFLKRTGCEKCALASLHKPFSIARARTLLAGLAQVC